MDEDLQAAELVWAVGEQPALVGGGLGARRLAEESGPVVPDAAGRACRARREHEERLRVAGAAPARSPAPNVKSSDGSTRGVVARRAVEVVRGDDDGV